MTRLYLWCIFGSAFQHCVWYLLKLFWSFLCLARKYFPSPLSILIIPYVCFLPGVSIHVVFNLDGFFHLLAPLFLLYFIFLMMQMFCVLYLFLLCVNSSYSYGLIFYPIIKPTQLPTHCIFLICMCGSLSRLVLISLLCQISHGISVKNLLCKVRFPLKFWYELTASPHKKHLPKNVFPLYYFKGYLVLLRHTIVCTIVSDMVSSVIISAIPSVSIMFPSCYVSAVTLVGLYTMKDVW